MDQDTLRQLIAAEVRRAIVPLETEIQWLKAEVQSLKAKAPAQGSAAPAPEAGASMFQVASPPAAEAAPAPLPGLASVPEDRSDFARFLARGLEQEAREYAEEKTPEPEKKRGWNPFKR